MTRLEARPKGSMCVTCVHALHACDHLEFDRMPVIGRDDDGRAVVRCTAYKKDAELHKARFGE